MAGCELKYKNPVVAQPIRLDVSAGLQYELEHKEVGSNSSEEKDVLAREGKEAENKSLHLQWPHMDFQQKVQPRL